MTINGQLRRDEDGTTYPVEVEATVGGDMLNLHFEPPAPLQAGERLILMLDPGEVRAALAEA